MGQNQPCEVSTLPVFREGSEFQRGWVTCCYHTAAGGGGLVAKSMSHSCDPVDCSPTASVHGISQTRILEWVAIPFSRGSSRPRDRTQVSCTAGRVFTN